MVEIVRAMKLSKGDRAHRAALMQRHGIRLYNPETGKYLHLSGAGEVKGTVYAWAGFRHQADKLRAKAGSWPYTIVDLVEVEVA